MISCYGSIVRVEYACTRAAYVRDRWPAQRDSPAGAMIARAAAGGRRGKSSEMSYIAIRILISTAPASRLRVLVRAGHAGEARGAPAAKLQPGRWWQPDPSVYSNTR